MVVSVKVMFREIHVTEELQMDSDIIVSYPPYRAALRRMGIEPPPPVPIELIGEPRKRSRVGALLRALRKD